MLRLLNKIGFTKEQLHAYESVNYPNYILYSSSVLSFAPTHLSAAPLYKKDVNFFEVDDV